jgi:hypothetical protein
MVTRVKKNMKNKLMSLIDKILLLKRALIESVFGKIKLLGKFEHSRHRSVTNAFVHMVAALISYQLSDNKPSIKSLLQLQDFYPSNAKLALIQCSFRSRSIIF